MTAADQPADRATVVVGHDVVKGRESDFVDWQRRIDRAAAAHAGYQGSEVVAPIDASGRWSVIFRFDTVDNLRDWMESDERATLIGDSDGLFASTSDQRVLVGGSDDEGVVTVVAAHHVPADLEDDFSAWIDRLTTAVRSFPGFRGVETFRPVEGVEQRWTVLFRFADDEQLERWLTSDERQAILAEGPESADSADSGRSGESGDVDLRRIPSSFGGWFRFEGDGAATGEPAPARWKTALTILIGLYPTVFLLTLVLSELWPDRTMWAAVLITNVAAVAFLTWVVMPRLTAAFGFWLQPRTGADQPATDRRGMLIAVGAVAACAVAFWLTTEVIWSLP